MVSSPLDDRGYLPPGIHRMSREEFVAAFVGPGRRADLWARLKLALDDLHAAGIDHIYIGGSYVTNEEEPGDIDGYWIVPPGRDGPKSDPVPYRNRSGINLFPDVLNTWEQFLSTNRDGEEVGLVALWT